MKKGLTVIAIIFVVIVGIFIVQRRLRNRTVEDMEIESNSWIMDLPTIEDEKPITEYANTQWWAWYGYLYTEDGENELLLNANVYPRDSTLFGNSYTLNGDVYTFNFKSIEWDETTNILHGEMERERDEVAGTWTLTFPEEGFRVYEQEIDGETLRLEIKSRGIPLWGAKTDDQMLQVGWVEDKAVYGGGYHDAVYIRATLTREESATFEGHGLWARVRLTEKIGIGEAVVGCINDQPEFYMNFFFVRNPYDLNEIFVRQGRIGFPDKAYQFDDFTYTGDKWPDLDWFRIEGTYQDGRVDLTGERIGYMHNRQMHPLIRWTGTITRDGQTINVDSLGTGEFRQIDE